MARFVQIIEFQSSRIEEIEALGRPSRTEGPGRAGARAAGIKREQPEEGRGSLGFPRTDVRTNATALRAWLTQRARSIRVECYQRCTCDHHSSEV